MSPIEKRRMVKIWATTGLPLIIVAVVGWLVAVRVFDRDVSLSVMALTVVLGIWIGVAIADIDRRKRLPPG